MTTKNGDITADETSKRWMGLKSLMGLSKKKKVKNQVTKPKHPCLGYSKDAFKLLLDGHRSRQPFCGKAGNWQCFPFSFNMWKENISWAPVPPSLRPCLKWPLTLRRGCAPEFKRKIKMPLVPATGLLSSLGIWVYPLLTPWASPGSYLVKMSDKEVADFELR